MNLHRCALRLLAMLPLATGGLVAAEELVTLQGAQAELLCAPAGGAIVAFRLKGQTLNPLNWEVPADIAQSQPKSTAPRGHFLCLDRWGAPSEAELKNGMPFHGEAPYATWTVEQPPRESAGALSAEMSCLLPLAGLRVDRRLELDADGTVFRVTERVTNTARLGRVYNMVQHPTIAPPFLSADTVIDTNAREGLSQDEPPPTSRAGSPTWPQIKLRGAVRDLRRLETGTEREAVSDVTSFVFADGDEWGWVTASHPRQKLLIGYVWKTADYPWLNIWRYRQGDKRLARGLEFGTTGYHQPFPVLVRTGRLLDRATYEFLDANETATRSFLCFLAAIPEDYQGVANLKFEQGEIRLLERRDAGPREISLPCQFKLGMQ
ncbi:MAG: hypothetical protein EHM42_05860 [Planctomycetaceae bacterium]|nr:MAG: hypothetical protein EHM42_11260 [Planctomycetaceae bacterium]RPI86594.1 MAG: hypothetical protein EHM42_05860 [Planctomycetaceae bacterium]